MHDWPAVLQQLVRIRSVFGEEHAAVAIVEDQLARLGIPVTSVPFVPDQLSRLPGAQPPFGKAPARKNLIATLKGRGTGRSIIINSHLDILSEGDPGEWRHPPFSGDIEDGRIYGRGAYDDKAGVVICLALLERFSQKRLGGDLIAHFVLEDETTGNGSLLCLEHGPRADAAIIVDGTRGDRGINDACWQREVRCDSARAAGVRQRAHMGVNAAEMLARLVIDIRHTVLGLNSHNVAPWTQYPSPNQCSVVALNCPEAALTVPALASAVCYATFTPPHSLTTFRALLESTVQRFSIEHGLGRTPSIDWNGLATEPVGSRTAELEAVIRSAAVDDIPFGPSTGTSDMRHFVAREIPCVLFGPGQGRNPHRADEYFELSSLSKTTEILSRAIEAWCR